MLYPELSRLGGVVIEFTSKYNEGVGSNPAWCEEKIAGRLLGVAWPLKKCQKLRAETLATREARLSVTLCPCELLHTGNHLSKFNPYKCVSVTASYPMKS